LGGKSSLINYLSLCVSIKNEAPYLNEWIAYNMLQGVEYFYVNDDHSDDNSLEVLKPWMNKGIVELHTGFKQIEFFKFIAKEKKNETEWLAFFDLDEFYQGDKTLKEFLYELEDNVVALELFWKHYGDSGLSEPDDRLVIERFVKHSYQEFYMNSARKIVCKPRFINEIASPHLFSYSGGRIVNSGDTDFIIHAIWDNCRLNHYHTKTKPEYDKKFARGRAFGDWRYEFSKFNRNEILDDSMLKWIYPTKNLIADMFGSF
jgi:hypothetical protein